MNLQGKKPRESNEKIAACEDGNFSPQQLVREDSAYQINYEDQSLFGLDDSRYEDFELLKSYSVERPDCKRFFDPSLPVIILRAPKGTGKTTLCRLLENNLSQMTGHVSILRFDSEISPSLKQASLSDWIRSWKKNIAEAVLLALANKEYFSHDPDMIGIIERAEKQGYKKKNFVGLFREEFSLSFVKSKPDQASDIRDDHILKRINERIDSKIWIFLDEIDQYFTLDNDSILKVAAMLIAAREITSLIGNLTIRITIKPNVFSVLHSRVDTMSNMRQLIVDLHWTAELIRSVLAKRIESYIERNNLNHIEEVLPPTSSSAEREAWLISQVFSTKNFDLGGANRPPHVVLSSLGFYRPRWVIEICRICAEQCKIPTGKLITMDDVKLILEKYGNIRISDLASEYQSQCAQIETILNRFNGSRSAFSSLRYLLEFVKKKITDRTDIKIVGVSDVASPREVVRFLYQIGFIDPKKLISHGKYTPIHFHERPGLIDSEKFDDDDSFIWEIHPSFRRALSISRQSNVDLLNELIGDRYIIFDKKTKRPVSR